MLAKMTVAPYRLRTVPRKLRGPCPNCRRRLTDWKVECKLPACCVFNPQHVLCRKISGVAEKMTTDACDCCLVGVLTL